MYRRKRKIHAISITIPDTKISTESVSKSTFPAQTLIHDFQYTTKITMQLSLNLLLFLKQFFNVIENIALKFFSKKLQKNLHRIKKGPTFAVQKKKTRCHSSVVRAKD